MKKFMITAFTGFAAFLLSLSAAPTAHAAGESFLKVPVSLSYSSTYWWRGVELNGKDIGVAWGSAGLELGDTGLTLSAAAGLSEDYMLQTDDSTDDYKTNKKSQKALTEYDYGISYAAEFADLVSLGLGVMYVHYAYYDEADSTAIDPSFWEGSFSLGIKTVLNPTVNFYYDYYVEERTGSDGTKTPVNEDYYVKFSVSQDVYSADGFTFGIGAWAAYYNNAYLEADGWSDAGISLRTSKETGNARFSGAAYYARSLSSDFQKEYTGVGKLKNHLWAEFGVGYTF